jgi:hypothetical protein
MVRLRLRVGVSPTLLSLSRLWSWGSWIPWWGLGGGGSFLEFWISNPKPNPNFRETITTIRLNDAIPFPVFLECGSEIQSVDEEISRCHDHERGPR